MFKGYNPDRRPPYTQKVDTVINGVAYVITYIVANGPAGSISVSSVMERKKQDEEESIR